MHDQDPPQVFLSYAKPDQHRVTPFFESLEKSGFNVWYDCKRLKPGQNWDFEIKRALDKASIVIAFLSENSINRRGYAQREIKIALDKLSEKLIDDIYLIPVMLDDGILIPDQLQGIQCISANASNCMIGVVEALNLQLNKLGVETQKLQVKEELSWSFQTKKEICDGLPGYETELQFIRLQSTKYPALYEAGEYIQGRLLESLFSSRSSMLDQAPSQYNFGQEKYRRTNTYDAHCSDPVIKGRVLTIQYAIHWYGAGAAHPNIDFCTYSFVMAPLILIESLEQIFITSSEAFLNVQNSVRNKLMAIKLGSPEEEHQVCLDSNGIALGTQNWSDFNSFIFKEDCIEFLFAPYQVAAYACGPQFAEVPYIELIEFIRPEYQSALEIEHIAWQKKRATKLVDD
ncbi:hypothetical protein CFter6_1841 [Collimonas fungivorans]|uniref:TIR domain-containing protein n=1 Tax=Collimonas fungivorans TaxID=158899 RepID=A0A127P9V5_9BURK|nr:TIR domain-containing protein [Collimonas fungivorans]AMO94538.1 hypothetical protein CFter6_1841 [Collimonas fungivorans]